jgi:hypothetical protein
MSVHLRTRRAAIAIALTLALGGTLAACGGGGSGDDASGNDVTTTKAIDDPGDITVPGFEPEEHEFGAPKDGGKARFINLLANDGEGIDMDVYWGVDATTGKKAATVKYGEVSDWMPIQVDQDPLFVPADGEPEINVAFYPAGETEREMQFMQDSENLDGDVRYTYAMGTGDGEGLAGIPASLSLAYEHEAGEPPAGKAWVALNSVGIGGIEGGDFMVLSTADGCNDLEGTDIEGGTANSGQAFVVDTGESSFTASDANTECAKRTEAVDLDLKEGDRYVLYAYGTSLEDRQLLPVKIGD